MGALKFDHTFEAIIIEALDADAIGVDVRLEFAALMADGNKFHGTGMIHAERILDDIEMVRTPVAVFAATVVKEAAPAAAVVAFNAQRVIGAPRRGPKPTIIVEISRDGFFGQLWRGGKFTEARTDQLDVADPTIAHDLGGFAEGFIGALLRAGLENSAVVPRRLDEYAALTDGERLRFFAVNVFAGFHRSIGHGSVPVVGRADKHGVDIRAREQLFVRRINIGTTGRRAAILEFSVGGADAGAHFFGFATHDIARGDDLTIRGTAKDRTGMGVTDKAVAHETERDAVTRGPLTKQGCRKKIRRGGVGDDASQTTLEDRATREENVLHDWGETGAEITGY